MSDSDDPLVQARTAFTERRWPDAYAALTATDRPLTADDLAVLADCAWWLGRVDESIDAGERAFQAFAREQRPRPAAMAAIGVAINHLMRGAEVAGSGWVGRAAALLDGEPECAEQGYLSYLVEVQGALDDGDRDVVLTAARRVADLGRRLGDATLVAAGLVGEGRVLVRQGHVRDGMARFDEAMTAVVAGEVLPDWAGDLYCNLMSASHEVGDLRRARAWVQATEEWLATLPAAVLFTGMCRVHRSQVLQAAGEWARSEREAARVCTELDGIDCLSSAEGHYQLGELARLRGRPAAAERSYRRAHHLGRDPQPGWALLRLQQGRPDAAATSVRAALLAERTNPLVRARLLIGQVEIALAGDDRTTAEVALAELADTAARYDSPCFTASARQWEGAILLSSADAGGALPALSAACRSWRGLHAPYDCARVRVLLAAAYRELGDADAADLELTAAAEVFDRLGAAPDAAAVAALRGEPALPGGLTDREAQVLACLASGRTNAQIAEELVISAKTVARHLSNIFAKLDVGTRTAAAAWAHEHGLAGSNDPSPARRDWVVRSMRGGRPRS
ncbi:helix-turn-helix transcriptional regulator [Trujillonella humicola]|uniref:helix-turn-helix transcriptional regulator n=1 Tax=Trujillonella humicola TaxID=3383699 RepID=UPI003905C818